MITVWGVLVSYIMSGGNSYCIRLWEGHRLKNSLMQTLFLSNALGYVVSPFIVRPFLVNLPTACWKIINNGSSTLETNTTVCSNITARAEDVGHIRYPFGITGLALFAVSYISIIPYLKERKAETLLTHETTIDNANTQEQNQEQNTAEIEITKTSQSHSIYFRTTFLLLDMLVLFIFPWCRITAVFYLPTFAITFLHWPAKEAALLSSLLMTSVIIVGLASIPLSVKIGLRSLLCFSLFCSTLGFTLVLFVETGIGYYLVWIATVFAGMGFSIFLPTILLWTSNYIAMTGSVASRLYYCVVNSGYCGSFSYRICFPDLYTYGDCLCRN